MKISNIEGVLNRNEMKKIMAGWDTDGSCIMKCNGGHYKGFYVPECNSVYCYGAGVRDCFC